MPVNARRFIRKMRGGAQAHLLECDDGHFYVVKFRNNPQHRRILVNEWISTAFLEYLPIAAPAAAIVNLSDDFLREHPEVHLQLGKHRIAAEPGWHFGSRYPGDPARMAVYDFLPDALIPKVENLLEFRGVLAFDKWMGNADSRQAIFFRARLREWLPAQETHPLRLGFIAQMMDHGYVFDGPHWSFHDSPLAGIYFRRQVYGDVTSERDLEPWLDRIGHFPEEVVDRAYKQIPPQWIEGDEAALQTLLERLLARRKRVAELIRDCSRGKTNPFPNWK